MRCRIWSLKRMRSPMKRMRTPCRWSSATSRSSAVMNSFISAPTSSSGRPQFSLENANSVSASMPCSRQNSTQTVTARAPARWPIARGRRRCCAQRPLPSMMTARWRGMRALCGVLMRRSDRHQLLFLGAYHLVDVLDGLVGEFLDVRFAACRLVLGDLLVFQQLLDVVVGIAADIADGDLGVLPLAMDVLGQFLATLFGESGQVDADDGAGRVGRQAQVRRQDRYFDRV